MAIDDEERSEQGVLKRAGSLWRKNQPVLEIHDIHVGDITTELTVYVSSGAVVAGNVSAPRLVLAGTQFGFVTVRELIIEAGGRLLGDAYTVAMQLAPVGKIHGWVSTLDEGTLELLRAGELSAADVPPIGEYSFPGSEPDAVGEMELLSTARSQGDDVERIAVWHQLQTELASALLARAEIENAFEIRVAGAVSRETAMDSDGEMAISEEQPNTELPLDLNQSLADSDRLLWTQTQLKQARLEMDELRSQLDAEHATATTRGRRMLAMQATAVRFEKQLESCKRRAAELRAALDEKGIELDEARHLAREKYKQLKQVRKLAVTRIQQLEAELEATRS